VPNETITVKVENGWVTLEGEVDWAYQKDAAANAVRYLTGVHGISNLINVKPRVRTVEIREKISEAFKRSAELDAKRIIVEASEGKVTLSGRVHSWLEHDEAARIAWAAPGVSKVDNRINVSA
jgi:osmotically-inducible protein OsmY